MNDLIILILSILACYRLSIAVAWESGPFGVLAILRSFFAHRANTGKIWHTLADLVHCPYCVGFWVALVICLIYRPSILWWFAIAGGQVILTKLADDGEAAG